MKGSRFLALGAVVLLASCSLFKDTETFTGGGIGTIDAGVHTTTAYVPHSGQVKSVERVTLTGFTHVPGTSTSIQLESPGGLRVTLVASESNSFGGTYGFTDDDDSYGLVRRVYSGVTLVPEVYQADGDFEDFEERDVRGNWTLRINAGQASGSLGSWSLTLEYEEY